MRLISLLLLVWYALSQPLASAGEPASTPGLASDMAGYAQADSCLGCHARQAGAWKNSDHDWAMREAKPKNILGDFNNARFSDTQVTTRFFRKGQGYFVSTEGADGKVADFEIRYTFGHFPLQQYLIALPGGRLQALTIAWDSRPKAAGGQRWFSLYPGQQFAPGDPLHWTGRYQNWNAMCADCHSSNVLKHYNDKQDTFASTWHEPNVGCQGCHGPGQAHVDWAKGASGSKPYASMQDIGLKVDFKVLGSKGLVEQCAYCHSRRQSLGVGQQPGQSQLLATLPATLRQDLYHPDGQIEGEVYEYGSFVQSKMFAAGVACTDCHDPHTTKVKIEGNGLCQQCHNPAPPSRFPSLRAKNYDTPEHHHHVTGSPGAQCVNCHMPAKTYMIVDPRRDHSLRIPRPDLDAKTGSPDACTSCHQGKSPTWAAKEIDGWFGPQQRPSHYGETFHTLREGSGDSLALLSEVIRDLGKPAIVRATAAEQLASLGAPAMPSLSQALKDDSPLVRTYAIAGFTGLPPEQRVQYLLELLDDPALSVRDEVLRALVGIPTSSLPADRQEAFMSALADYEQRLRSNADLPGNRLNLAVFLQRDNRQLEALEEYRQALRLDPYFSPARVNLVNLSNELLRQAEAEKVLREGLALKGMPEQDHGNLAYMLALFLVEHDKAEEALQWFETAANELPQNSRIRYNQGLLLLQLQRTDQAREKLLAGLKQTPMDADLVYALIYLHAATGRSEQARVYLQQLENIAPYDERLPALRQQLKSR